MPFILDVDYRDDRGLCSASLLVLHDAAKFATNVFSAHQKKPNPKSPFAEPLDGLGLLADLVQMHGQKRDLFLNLILHVLEPATLHKKRSLGKGDRISKALASAGHEC